MTTGSRFWSATLAVRRWEIADGVDPVLIEGGKIKWILAANAALRRVADQKPPLAHPADPTFGVDRLG